jgi:GTP-binding protein EngB required for normal cell division
VDALNESQRRRLYANAQYADKLFSDIEEILVAAESKSAFPKYRPDLSLHQTRLTRGHITRFRDHLTRVLAAVGVEPDSPRFSALHSIRTILCFVRICAEEMAPQYLRGYGALSPEMETHMLGVCNELEGLVNELERTLALGAGADLQARLDRLGDVEETALVRALDRITNQQEMAEFRAPLQNLLEKMESRVFEIAVFGRVSSGKSSLLNHVLQTEALPVGVNPITAVPTRLVFGQEPGLTVTFANRQVRRGPVEDLAKYASEEENPGNQLGITRLVVELDCPRLREGMVLVDTPGLGALATAGAAETLSYLPRCDLGIVLISAVNPLNDEDLNTLAALTQAGISAMALLSKADLLAPGDRRKAVEYSEKEIRNHLGLEITVHPVSTVGSEEQLLERWFAEHLAPLSNRHVELARESLRRKALLVRESVIAALRSKLGRTGANAPADAHWEAAERVLRDASAAIEETRRYCYGALGDARAAAAEVLSRSVSVVIQSWGQTSSLTDGVALVRDVAERMAAESSARIAEKLRQTAQELRAALTRASEALEARDSDGDEPLDRVVREMPRFEAALPEIGTPRPWFHSIGILARPWLSSRLGVLNDALETSFRNHERALEAWTSRVLAAMQSQFDARADAYRAQLSRLLSRKTEAPSSEDRTAMERDLADLEAIGDI